MDNLGPPAPRTLIRDNTDIVTPAGTCRQPGLAAPKLVPHDCAIFTSQLTSGALRIVPLHRLVMGSLNLWGEAS